MARTVSLLLTVVMLATAAQDQVIDFEQYSGTVGQCDGPVPMPGTTCTWVAKGFTFKFLAEFLVTNNTLFPNIDNDTRFLVPSYIPELQPGVPEKPLMIEFEKPVRDVALDVHLGNPLSPALVRAIGVKDEIVAATHVLSGMRVSFDVKGKNRIKRLEIGVTSTRTISAFAIDNIVVDRAPAGILTEAPGKLKQRHLLQQLPAGAQRVILQARNTMRAVKYTKARGAPIHSRTVTSRFQTMTGRTQLELLFKFPD